MERTTAIALGAVAAAFLLARRRAGRGRLGGLAASESVHADEAGRAMLLAEKASNDAEDAMIEEDCGAGYHALARARTALATAHAHTFSLARPEHARREVAAVGQGVLAVERKFKRACLVAADLPAARVVPFQRPA